MSVYASITAKLDAIGAVENRLRNKAGGRDLPTYVRETLLAAADDLKAVLDSPVVEEGPDLTSRRTDGRCILHFDLDPAAQWTDEQTLEHFLRCTKSEDQLEQWRLTMARAGQGWRCIEHDHEDQLERCRQTTRDQLAEIRALGPRVAPPEPRDGILLEYLLTEALKVVKG